MGSRGRRRWYRRFHHQQFIVVDGKWSVNAYTVQRGEHVAWRCQLQEDVDGRLVPVGTAHLRGTRAHAERWAHAEIEAAKAKELCLA